MLGFAVVASALAVAVALVALVKLLHQTKARAVLVSARVRRNESGPRLVIEVCNTSSSAVTVAALGVWLSTDKRHGLPDDGELREWEELWDLQGSMIETGGARWPAEIDGGVWKAWEVQLETDSPVGQPATRTWVTAYLKSGGKTSVLVDSN